MPRLIDSSSRADTLTVAVNHVIATDGAAALSLRRIADVSRVSPAAMLKQFGSRARLLRVAAKRTSDDLLADFVEDQPGVGLLALLPRPTWKSWCDDATVLARVWMGWLELARSDVGVEATLSDHRRTLQAFVTVLTEGRVGPDRIRGLLALATGLQSAMADPVAPLSPAAATERLVETLRCMRIPVAPVAPGESTPERLVVPLRWMRRGLRPEAWRPEPALEDAMKFNNAPCPPRSAGPG